MIWKSGKTGKEGKDLYLFYFCMFAQTIYEVCVEPRFQVFYKNLCFDLN